MYSFVITSEVRRRQEIIQELTSWREKRFGIGYNTCRTNGKESNSMNITFYLTLLTLAIAGSVLMTYYESVRDRRFSKKKRKKKMKVAWTAAVVLQSKTVLQSRDNLLTRSKEAVLKPYHPMFVMLVLGTDNKVPHVFWPLIQRVLNRRLLFVI